MKVLYLESKRKDLNVNLDSSQLKVLPKNIFLVYTIQYKEIAENIKIGLNESNSNGELLAHIINKKTEASRMVVVTETGEVLEKYDPILKDITLKLNIKTESIAGEDYYLYFNLIKVGKIIRISTPQIDLSGEIIEILWRV